jgi:hypothetical protein
MTDSIDIDNPPPEEMGNRTFIIIGAILAAVLVFAVVAIIGVLIYVNASKPAIPSAGQTATSLAIGASKTASALTATAAVPSTATRSPTHPSPTPRPSTNTPLPSNTEVVNLTPPLALTRTPTPSATATVSGTPPTSSPTSATTSATTSVTTSVTAATKPTGTATALPKTGFGGPDGLLGLIVLAAVLVGVVFLARQLRMRQA